MARANGSTRKRTTKRTEPKPKGLPPVDFGVRFMRLETWLQAYATHHLDKEKFSYDSNKRHIIFHKTSIGGNPYKVVYTVPNNLGVLELGRFGDRDGWYIGDREQCEKLQPILKDLTDRVDDFMMHLDAKWAEEAIDWGYISEADAIAQGVVSATFQPIDCGAEA